MSSNDNVMPELTIDDWKTFKEMIKEHIGSQYRKDAEGEHQKEIRNRAKEELGVPTKLFNKIARTAYKHDKEEVEYESSVVVETVNYLEELNIY